MLRKTLSIAFAAAVGSLVLNPTAISAQELPRTHFKVSGGTSMLNMYNMWHGPFWSEHLAKVSNGRITADIAPHNEMGMKGPEILRLLKLGVLDIAHSTISYMAGDDSSFEGLDLAGLTLDIEVTRKAADAYKPVLSKRLAEKHNVKLLTFTPVTKQVFFCREKITRLADLKGKKVRVFNVTMADYIEASGGVTVMIPFVEVLPAMQRGVADCAVTGTATGNRAKWYEVTSYLYTIPMGWSMTFFGANLDFWKGLDPKVRAFLLKEIEVFEDNMWKQAGVDVQDGINCNTGVGECRYGTKAEPRMTLVTPSEEDRALHAKFLQAVVVPKWAKRCGADCAKTWNETIGKVVNITAPTK